MKTTWAKVPVSVRRAMAAVPQTVAARELAYRLTSRRLRILAFHGVGDQGHFQRVVEAICDRYTPVSANEVHRSLNGAVQLPDHAVWFTFDDGLPSTFEAGAMLAAHGVEATAFICPSVIDKPALLWFQVLELCKERELVAAHEEDRFSPSRLKSLPDAERRAETELLFGRLTRTGYLPPVGLTTEALRTWVDLGHEVGNHTWDHPCLDQCTAEEQRRQVTRAHEWLQAKGFASSFFAYPNGNWTTEAEATAKRLGYEGAVLFDHALQVQPVAHTHQMSRLRIDSDASVRRALSIVSGAHPVAFRVLSKAAL